MRDKRFYDGEFGGDERVVDCVFRSDDVRGSEVGVDGGHESGGRKPTINRDNPL